MKFPSHIHAIKSDDSMDLLKKVHIDLTEVPDFYGERQQPVYPVDPSIIEDVLGV